MPKKEQYPEITYGAIWKNLSQVDCSKHAKNKNNLTYLAWNEAWALLMEHYPESTFVYLDNEVYPDGSVSVVCQVEIHGLTRRMWLPVMNYANKTIPNPSSRDISDNKMRCLVKTIGLFGLGFHIYRGQTQPEDMFEDDSPDMYEYDSPQQVTKKATAPAVVKKTNKKSVAVTDKVAEGVKKEAQEEAQEKADAEFYLSWTDDDAQVWVDKMFEVAEKFAESPDGARSQWQANKKTIDHLTINHPKAYESLKEKFTNLSNKLKTQEGNNDE
jgi:hypothetical protein